MFQFVNVASISKQSCCGYEHKEEELHKKNFLYITSYGLALAVDAIRHRCHAYSEAIQSSLYSRTEVRWHLR